MKRAKAAGRDWRIGSRPAVLSRPWLYRMALRCARLVLRPVARDGWLRKLPEPGAGWTATRDFPRGGAMVPTTLARVAMIDGCGSA